MTMSFEHTAAQLFSVEESHHVDADRAPQKPRLPLLYSRLLMQGGQAVNIVHNDSTYKLQITKLGKLILTK